MGKYKKYTPVERIQVYMNVIESILEAKADHASCYMCIEIAEQCGLSFDDEIVYILKKIGFREFFEMAPDGKIFSGMWFPSRDYDSRINILKSLIIKNEQER